LSIGPAISNFLGPVMAGLLIDYAGPQPADIAGFQWAFLLLAMLPLSTWFWVRAVPELHAPKAPGEVQPRRAMDLLAEPMMRRLLGVNWVLSSCWDVHTFVVPVLGHERGYSASVVGTILGAFAVAATFIRVCLPFISRHVKEYQIITGSMDCTAMLFGLYPYMPTAWAMGFWLLLLLVQLFLGAGVREAVDAWTPVYATDVFGMRVLGNVYLAHKNLWMLIMLGGAWLAYRLWTQCPDGQARFWSLLAMASLTLQVISGLWMVLGALPALPRTLHVLLGSLALVGALGWSFRVLALHRATRS
jgi:hypothetical protein